MKIIKDILTSMLFDTKSIKRLDEMETQNTSDSNIIIGLIIGRRPTGN